MVIPSEMPDSILNILSPTTNAQTIILYGINNSLPGKGVFIKLLSNSGATTNIMPITIPVIRYAIIKLLIILVAFFIFSSFSM